MNGKRPADRKITIKYDDDPYSKNTVKPSGDDPSPTKGEDGTDFGPGASESVVDKAATSWKKESDPKGSKFSLLQAKATAKKTSVKVTWKKASGAKKYVIYGNACGSTKKLKKIVKKTTKTKYSFKKVAGKKVKKGTYYKFMVVAFDKNNKVISTSKIVHVATSGGKVGNDKKVTTKAKKNRVTLKMKKSFKLKAKAVPASKKLSVHRHRNVEYESTNPAVAKVTSKGVVKAKKKGACYVYAYAQNGISSKIKITVK